MKGLYSNKSASFHFGLLLYFSFMGFLFGMLSEYAISSITAYLTGIESAVLQDKNFYAMQASQFFSASLIFLVPAICTAYLCSLKPTIFLNIKKINPKTLLLSAVMLLLISPAIDITTYINSLIPLPELMAKAEALAAEITEKMLNEKGVFPLIINILIVCVLVGLAEEFFFRGALLSIIRKTIKNPHIAIWTIAIIFSIIHFQFSGFIPRMFLGAFLGYLLYWTNNIWAPVFAHFLNNAIAVAGYKSGLFQLSSESAALISEDTSQEGIYITIAVAIAGLILFALCIKKIKEQS